MHAESERKAWIFFKFFFLLLFGFGAALRYVALRVAVYGSPCACSVRACALNLRLLLRGSELPMDQGARIHAVSYNQLMGPGSLVKLILIPLVFRHRQCALEVDLKGGGSYIAACQCSAAAQSPGFGLEEQHQ